MCGIVGYIGKQEAPPLLLQGLSKLEYRGYDSAGIAVHNGSNLDIIKTKGRLSALEEKLANTDINGSLGIGHTRWATHGAPSDVNSHPHFNSKQTIAVVHNGIIENYMHLKDELEKEGYVFATDTDTETAAHLIDYYYKQGMDLMEAVEKTIGRLEGSYALGVICKDFPDRLIAARKDSPLVLGLGQGENFAASDMPAILNHTRDIYLLDDGDIALITSASIQVFNGGHPVEKEIFKVEWDIEAAEKGGYDYFMLKEIHEQPKVVRDTIMPRLKDDGIRLDNIKLMKEDLDGISRIYIVACGTAYHAGLIGKYLIEQLTRIPVVAEMASEFRYNEPIIDKNTLLIVISQSGETADTLAAVRLAKNQGARVLGVVNVVGSAIARESQDLIYTMAGPEIAVASTKAFSAQVSAMYLIAIHFGMELGRISMEEFVQFKAELEELPLLADKILKRAHKIEALVEKYLNAKNVFYVGRGLDYFVAMEGSLKLKEIAYLHSEPYAAGELKHGPIALIEESTLIVGVVTQERVFEKTMSNLKECKARGARIMAIAMKGNEDIKNYADDVFYIPRSNWMFAPLLSNIPQQLFAYYMALGLGNDVDKPRNLAKSVTVE